MIRPSGVGVAVFLCVEPVDFRKQSAGLAEIVQGDLTLNPFDRAIFGFVNRRRNQCRLLMWERNGFVLWGKRLEKELFSWPQANSATLSLSMQELNWLLDGLDLSRWRPHRALQFESVL
jgi:transposase